MITEQDLREAIAECEGERNPNANTCIKLAAFYTIRDHLFPTNSVSSTEWSPPSYSYAEPPKVSYSSESEFGKLIDGMELDSILPVMDELMDTLRVMMPRLYDGVMHKLMDA